MLSSQTQTQAHSGLGTASAASALMPSADSLDRILLSSPSTTSTSTSTARPSRPLPPVPSHSQQQPLQEQSRAIMTAAAAAAPDDDNGPFACKWRGCSLVFDDPEDLFSHCTNDHVGRKSAGSLCLKCAWLVPDPGANGHVMECGIEKAKRDHITSHIRVHVPLKPHQCTQCNKRFKRPQDLKKHERTHTHVNGAGADSHCFSGGEVNNNEHAPQFLPLPAQPQPQHQVPAVTVSQPMQYQQQASPLAMPAPVPTSAYLATPSSTLSQSPHFLPQQQQQQQYMQPPAAATQHFLHVASPLSPATHGFSPTAPAVNLIPPRTSSHQVPVSGSTPSSSMSMSMSPLAMPYGNMPMPSPLNCNINGIPNGTTSGAALSLGQQQPQQQPYITPNFMPYDNAQTPSPITKAANYPNAMQPGGGLAMSMAGRQPSPMPYPLTPDSSSSGMGTYNGYMQQAPQQQFHYSFDTQQQHQHQQQQQQQQQPGMYAFGPNSAMQQHPTHMPQPGAFPARAQPLKRDAYDDMDELDMFLDNAKKAKIAPSYNAGLAQSLDYLAPGLLSGNLLQTPILATMPAADSTTVLGFLDQLESAVCQQDSDIAAFLDQLDAGVFAADPLLAGGADMQPIHPQQQQQQQPMFTSFAQHTQLPPVQQPAQQPATRSSSTASSSSSSCYPGHYSSTTGASLGAAIGLPAAHVTSPSPTPADRSGGAKKQKDKNALFELRSTSSAEPSTKDLKKKKSKDNVLKAVVDQVAAAAAAATSSASASSSSASASGSRSGPAGPTPVSKPLGQFMRVAQDLVGGSSSRTAAAAVRSPTSPPALPPRSPVPAAAADLDALAGSMSAMSIAAAPAPAAPKPPANPAVQRAVYHVRAIRALRWHLHDQIAAEKRAQEAAAAPVRVS